MELKAGYKQTEVGVIPDKWNVVPLSAVVHFINGKAHEKHVRGAGKYIIVNSKFISTCGAVAKHSDICLSPACAGDILMVMSDVPNGRAIAKCFFVDIDRTYTINQRICALRASHAVGKFLFYVIDRNPFFLSFDDGVKQTNLRKSDVLCCPIPLPPTKAEQEAIAEALSDADALIESLEQLIAKKRHIKQGAMQELLRPKAGWIERTLLELAGGKKELFDDGDWIESEHITGEGIRLVQTGNIGVGKFLDRAARKYIFESSFISLHCKEIGEGDLLICRLAEPAGRACVLPNIGEKKIVTSVGVTIFRPPASIADRVFLANLFSTDQWFRAVSDRSGGTTHKRISRGSLGCLKIEIPSLPEQTAIATILSDMDAEIAALETKLAKYRQIKQGMMQELLTGRIRLV